MEKLLIAVCLALVALSVSALPVEPEEQRAAVEAVELDSETKNELSSVTPEDEEEDEEEIELDSETKKQILEDWLSKPAPLGIKNRKSLRYKISECRWLFTHEFRHIEKFPLYENGKKWAAIHESILKTGLSDDQQKLYKRRDEADDFCRELHHNVTKESGLDGWKNLPEEPPVDEALTAKECAQNHLKDSEGFKLPAEFDSWSRDKQANYCEETQERSLDMDIEDCGRKFRFYDFFAEYSEAEKKSYKEIKDGFTKCEEFFGWKTNWEEEEAPPKESAKGKPSGEESVEDKSSNEE